MAEEDKFGSVYDQLSEIAPPRSDVAQDDSLEETYAGTLSQRMKVSPKMTDTQVVDKRLFPILRKEVEWINNLMVGRIFPDTLNPLRNIIIKHLLQEYDDVSFAEAVCIAEVALTIALDGEGRLDIIHMYSKISETQQEEKGKI
jgi:hypothetical protein